MLYVGLDMHSTRIAVCALNQTGQVVHRAQVRGIEEVLRALKGLPDRFEVCYEASCAPLDRLAALRMEAEEDLIRSPPAHAPQARPCARPASSWPNRWSWRFAPDHACSALTHVVGDAVQDLNSYRRTDASGTPCPDRWPVARQP